MSTRHITQYYILYLVQILNVSKKGLTWGMLKSHLASPSILILHIIIPQGYFEFDICVAMNS